MKRTNNLICTFYSPAPLDIKRSRLSEIQNGSTSQHDGSLILFDGTQNETAMGIDNEGKVDSNIADESNELLREYV